MKKKLFSIAAVLAVCLPFALTLSCTKEPAAYPGTPEGTIGDIDKILAMGFDTSGMVDTDNIYLVEGDIAIDKNWLSEHLPTRQVCSTLIDMEYRDSITVSFENSIDPVWKTALLSAIHEWNTIGGCCLHFYFIESGKGDIEVINYTGDSRVWLYSKYPTSRAGKYIHVNRNMKPYADGVTLTPENRKGLMMHEIGHTVGLRHTDWQWYKEEWSDIPIPIPGTPNDEFDYDEQSIMRGDLGRRGYSKFSAYDAYAIRKLYPKLVDPRPSYSEKIQVGDSTWIVLWDANPRLDTTIWTSPDIENMDMLDIGSWYLLFKPKQAGYYTIRGEMWTGIFRKGAHIKDIEFKMRAYDGELDFENPADYQEIWNGYRYYFPSNPAEGTDLLWRVNPEVPSETDYIMGLPTTATLDARFMHPGYFGIELTETDPLLNITRTAEKWIKVEPAPLTIDLTSFKIGSTRPTYHFEARLPPEEPESMPFRTVPDTEDPAWICNWETTADVISQSESYGFGIDGEKVHCLSLTTSSSDFSVSCRAHRKNCPECVSTKATYYHGDVPIIVDTTIVEPDSTIYFRP